MNNTEDEYDEIIKDVIDEEVINIILNDYNKHKPDKNVLDKFKIIYKNLLNNDVNNTALSLISNYLSKTNMVIYSYPVITKLEYIGPELCELDDNPDYWKYDYSIDDLAFRLGIPKETEENEKENKSFEDKYFFIGYKQNKWYFYHEDISFHIIKAYASLKGDEDVYKKINIIEGYINKKYSNKYEMDVPYNIYQEYIKDAVEKQKDIDRTNILRSRAIQVISDKILNKSDVNFIALHENNESDKYNKNLTASIYLKNNVIHLTQEDYNNISKIIINDDGIVDTRYELHITLELNNILLDDNFNIELLNKKDAIKKLIKKGLYINITGKLKLPGISYINMYFNPFNYCKSFTFIEKIYESLIKSFNVYQKKKELLSELAIDIKALVKEYHDNLRKYRDEINYQFTDRVIDCNIQTICSTAILEQYDNDVGVYYNNLISTLLNKIN